MKKYIGILSGAIFVLAYLDASAYEISTHKMLTQTAVNKSILFMQPSLMQDLGLKAWGSGDYFASDGTEFGGFSTNHDIDIISHGAELEDGDKSHETRPFNHFFDPQNQRPLTIAGVILGWMSPDWILEDQTLVNWPTNNVALQISPPDWWTNNNPGGLTSFAVPLLYPSEQQIYSYRNGQQYLYRALTNPDPTVRNYWTSMMFQTLGMVVHHIQDMAQPQHVRNDQHYHEGNVNPKWSFYEQYIQGLGKPNSSGNSTLNMFLNSSSGQYPIPDFPTARQFWYTPNATSPHFTGMAEFTAQNYTSYGTEYGAKDFDGQFVGAAPGFPLPNGTNYDGTAKTVEPENATVTFTDNTTKSGTFNFVKGSIYDENTLSQTITQHLAASSLVNTVLDHGRRTPHRYYIETSVSDDDAYKVLLPRAVAFSTGLINHFFRGRLNLTPSGNGWTIQNASQQTMNGRFEFYAEDALGNRQPVTGGNVPWTGVIPAGQSVGGIVFTTPSTATKVIVVFRGQIGQEGNANVTTGWYATAGKVVANTTTTTTTTSTTTTTTQNVPCTLAETNGSNWQGTYADDADVELGSTAGTVQVFYYDPLATYTLTITSKISGQVLLVAQGAWQGTAPYHSFQFNPAQLGSTKIHFHENAPISDRPTIQVTCPGSSNWSPTL